jgi:hypothetical protein
MKNRRGKAKRREKTGECEKKLKKWKGMSWSRRMLRTGGTRIALAGESSVTSRTRDYRPSMMKAMLREAQMTSPLWKYSRMERTSCIEKGWTCERCTEVEEEGEEEGAGERGEKRQ